MNYLLLLILGIPIFSFAQISQSASQAISIGSAESILLDLPSSKLEIKYIAGTRVFIETKVQISIENKQLLNFIIQKGRYDLTKTLNKNTRCLHISYSLNKNTILAKGKVVQEQLSYIIYIPRKMTLVNSFVNND